MTNGRFVNGTVVNRSDDRFQPIIEALTADSAIPEVLKV